MYLRYQWLDDERVENALKFATKEEFAEWAEGEFPPWTANEVDRVWTLAHSKTHKPQTEARVDTRMGRPRAVFKENPDFGGRLIAVVPDDLAELILSKPGVQTDTGACKISRVEQGEALLADRKFRELVTKNPLEIAQILKEAGLVIAPVVAATDEVAEEIPVDVQRLEELKMHELWKVANGLPGVNMQFGCRKAELVEAIREAMQPRVEEEVT